MSLDGVSGLEPTSKQEVSGGLDAQEIEISEVESVFIVAVRVSLWSFRFEIGDLRLSQETLVG